MVAVFLFYKELQIQLHKRTLARDGKTSVKNSPYIPPKMIVELPKFV